MHFHLTLALLLSTLGSGLFAQSDSFAMQRALQRYTDAYGGSHDINGLFSVSVEGTQEQRGEVYDFLIRKMHPDLIRYRLTDGETSVVTAYNGITGWLQTDRGGAVATRELTADELSDLKTEALFEAPLFRHLENRDNSVELEGRDNVHRRETLIFKTREVSGRESRYFLDAHKPHILKTERLAVDGTIAMTILCRDYRNVDGYPFAFQVETRVGNKLASLVKIDSIAANPWLPSFFFKMPR